MAENDIRIAVIDDQDAVLKTLTHILTSTSYKVVTFTSAKEFIESDHPIAFQCLIVDVFMKDMTGIELHEWLLNRKIFTPIIFISAYADVPMAVESMKRGAIDFLTKPADNQKLFASLNKAISIYNKTIKNLNKQKTVEDRVSRLTTREKQIMDLLIQGYTTKVVASRLKISTNTADVHRARILHKLGVKSIPEMIHFVYATVLEEAS